MNKKSQIIFLIAALLFVVTIFSMIRKAQSGIHQQLAYGYSECVSSSQYVFLETGDIKISNVKVLKDVDIESIDIEYPYLNDNSDEIARAINVQIYSFLFFNKGHFILENDGFVTRINTRYNISYVDDGLISIYFKTSWEDFGGYADLSEGCNFCLKDGRLLALSDFYEEDELKKLLEAGMKVGTATVISDFPLNEDEKEEYFLSFLDDLGTYYEIDGELIGYMNYADNFFFTEDSICLIGEPYPSTVEAMIIELKIEKMPTIKSDI